MPLQVADTQHYVGNGEAKKARSDAQTHANANAPVEDYDDLSVDEAKEKLGGLQREGLEKARSYEKANKARKTLVGWLDTKIGD